MKKALLAAVLSTFAIGVQADAGYMLGITYNLDGQASLKNLGFTAKVLSSDEEDKWVGAVGVSLFPWSDKNVGVDLSAGYNFKDSTLLIGYDFLKSAPQISVGWTDTEGDPAPAPAPEPDPEEV